nr:MAG TPA: anti-sigma factor [Caudoviricetes sp.]
MGFIRTTIILTPTSQLSVCKKNEEPYVGIEPT